MRLIPTKNIKTITKYMNTTAAGRYVPYGLGSREIFKLLNSDEIKNKKFKKRKKLFRDYLNSIGNNSPVEDYLPEMLISSFLKPWRTAALSYLSQNQLKKYVQFEGLIHLEESCKNGKGVILLNSHWGLAEAAVPLFPMLGYNDFYTVIRKKGTDSLKIYGLKKKYQPRLIIFKDHSNAELFKTLYKAREVLQDGGIFHILGDGYHGKSSVNLNFLDRIRGFRGSFAELALSTQAAVLPLYISVETDGKLKVHIQKPLDMGSDDMDHEKRIEHMVQQYVSSLEDKWKNKPQHINWGFMEKYLLQVRQDIS